MNGGVEILLARMETHPEEFFNYGSRWTNLILDFEQSLDKVDFDKLMDGIHKCRQQEFTQKVMNKLVGEEQEDKEAFTRMRMQGSGGRVTLNTGAISGAIGMPYSGASATITIADE